jgi:hypothetical protein
MTNLSSPVASAASGLPENNMADVIDSLKRLERLGDENSKTVQKILEAAREIEARIVKLYDQYGDGVTISGASAFEFPKPTIDFTFDDTDEQKQRTKEQYASTYDQWEQGAKKLGVSPDLYDVSYTIETRTVAPTPFSPQVERILRDYPSPIGSVRCLVSRGSGGVSERVSENRDAAIRFADDLAKGLLIVIAQDLASQKGDNERALDVLLKAKEALPPPDTNPKIEIW